MESSEEDYDPHVHRIERLRHPTNNMETIFHLIKGTLGTGVLAMPEGFKHTGMINGIAMFVVIAVFATYCIHVLVQSQYILCKKKKVGLLYYSESVEAACDVGPPCFKRYRTFGPALTDAFLIFYQTGCCCIYWVFMGTNLKYVCDVYTPEKYPLYAYMLMLFVPCCLILCIRNLKMLAPFSMGADIVTFITFGVVFYYIFTNLNSNFNDRPAIGKVQNFPLFLGTVLFSLQSLPVTMAVENNMGTPEFFTKKPFGALNVGYAILGTMYLFVGVFGYWRYGEEISPSITMNFPPEEILADVIIISYCLAIFISYALNAFVPISIILHVYVIPRLGETGQKKHLWIEMLLRFLFVAVTCLFATTIPLLGLIISLCGSVCLSALGIVIPALLEICAYWEEGISTPKTFTFWKDIVIVVIGFFGLLSGLYSTISSMYLTLSTGEHLK